MLEHLNIDSHSRHFEAEQAKGEGKKGLSPDGLAGENQHSHEMIVNGCKVSLRASLGTERSKYGHGKRLLQGRFLFLNLVAAVFFHGV